MFDNNVGITGRIFPDTHPYFDIQKNESAKVLGLIQSLIPNRNEKYERYKELLAHPDWNDVEFNNESGGYVAIHKLHGKLELADNRITANELMNLGEGVELMPDIPNIKSADSVLFKKGEWEIKNLKSNSKNAIQQRLRDGKEQAHNIIIRLPIYQKPQIVSFAIHNSIILDSKG